MIEERTELGREVEEALNEVLAHVRGEAALPSRIVDDPSNLRIVAVRKKLGLSRRKFAERYHLDPRTVQDWEQGRRTPDQAARVLLTVIEREPEAVERALSGTG
jgi:putative transcriptional regulator